MKKTSFLFLDVPGNKQLGFKNFFHFVEPHSKAKDSRLDPFFSFCLDFFSFDETVTSPNYPVSLSSFVLLNSSNLFLFWLTVGTSVKDVLSPVFLEVWESVNYYLKTKFSQNFWFYLFQSSQSYFFNFFVRTFLLTFPVSRLSKGRVSIDCFSGVQLLQLAPAKTARFLKKSSRGELAIVLYSLYWKIVFNG